jgi:hypothetical protein
MILSCTAAAVLVPKIVAFVAANDVANITCHQAFVRFCPPNVPYLIFEMAWQHVLSGRHELPELPAEEVKLDATQNGSPSPPAQ